MSLSTFGERFLFARLVQALGGTTETDGDFAEAVGVGSSTITGYKSADEAPPAGRALAIAKRCGVDPGWLSFGDDSAAPAPSGWERWFATRREPASPLRDAIAAASGAVRKAELEPEDIPAPRGSGLVEKPRDAGKKAG